MQGPDDSFAILPISQQQLGVRRSRPRMTRFERARILSMRAEQIANGTVAFVERLEGEGALDLAEREFAAGRIPFIVRRFIPTADGGVIAEDWRLDELEPCDRRLAHKQPKDPNAYEAAETMVGLFEN